MSKAKLFGKLWSSFYIIDGCFNKNNIVESAKSLNVQGNFLFFFSAFPSCEVMKSLHDLACGENELCSSHAFPVLSATSSILICVVLWTQAKRVIPSSITVSVTRVLMAGPVRIGWMDITVIVHLVSNSRKLFWAIVANPCKLKSKLCASFLKK